MTLLLAFGAMLGFGLSDFLGGLSARRITLIQTLLLSQLTALIVGWVGILISGAPPLRHDLFWGALAGLMLPCGFGCFYYGLSRGRMSEVAPITAIMALLIPTLALLIAGAAFALSTYIGIGLAAAAVICLAQGNSAAPAEAMRVARARLGALGGGVLFGCFYIFIRQTAGSTSLWPIIAAQSACALSIVIFAAFFKRKSVCEIQPARSSLAFAAGCAVMLGNISFQLALEGGGFLPALITIVQLAPAVSVILAQLFLAERLRPLQYAGLAFAALAVVLINRT
jgi:drug/metabolite transporter (DMT)-like permease